MRIVLDTNVVVSALIWDGAPYKLMQAAIDGDLVICTSPALRAELRMVVAADPDDDDVIAAAVAAEADSIVSGDRDLRDLGTYRGLRILTSPPKPSRSSRLPPKRTDSGFAALLARRTCIVPPELLT